MKLIRYRPDNTGNLYQKADGSWNLRIPARAFKNFRGAAKRREYDMPVDRNAWPDIETYLKLYRPMLADSSSQYFFVGSRRRASTGVWSSLSRHVESLTRRYLWKCPGTGAHGFRHIVATSILKKSPNDWQTAALVLHDLPATVEAYYAHLRSSDGATRMYEMMAGTFSRM